ncbi:Phosphotransferase enzyme [Steccherinum ochraceum]|uniref:Altered inheritance of mitochondria protein 9, mitochondrial n=1 Tax=Steccherinum ochraceum TaxID=92696 RepID=A0A4R0RC51_9APHY|nr:Phosphotransferase enzyme [Steccherinum ochraceum]
MQQALRYVHFDVDALMHVGTQASGGVQCTGIKKYTEGAFNKIFILAFENGHELIAKIPTQLLPAFYTTASEVATMDYARTILGMPVPKVWAWSADAADPRGVGAEFVIMDKVSGDALSERWAELPRPQWLRVIREVIELNRRFSERKFSQIGSIFYKEDVSEELQQRSLYAAGVDAGADGASERFRIGPMMDWNLWRGKRKLMKDVDRGPWQNTVAYMQAVAQLEKQWLRQYARVPPPGSPLCRHPEEDNINAHIALLDLFIELASHIPLQSTVTSPVLWHTDMHGENILLDTDSDHPPRIVAMLDWQNLVIAPLFLQSGVAKFCQYTGTAIEVHPGIRRIFPSYPDDFAQLPADKQAQVSREFDFAARQTIYEWIMLEQVPAQRDVVSHPLPYATALTVFSLSRTWLNGGHRLREDLLNLILALKMTRSDSIVDSILERHQTTYTRLIATPPPEYVSLYRSSVDNVTWALGFQLSGKAINPNGDPDHLATLSMSIDREGWVPMASFPAVKTANDFLKERWVPERDGGPYPYQDGALAESLD